jgi:hypothetical protein
MKEFCFRSVATTWVSSSKRIHSSKSTHSSKRTHSRQRTHSREHFQYESTALPLPGAPPSRRRHRAPHHPTAFSRVFASTGAASYHPQYPRILQSTVREPRPLPYECRRQRAKQACPGPCGDRGMSAARCSPTKILENSVYLQYEVTICSTCEIYCHLAPLLCSWPMPRLRS